MEKEYYSPDEISTKLNVEETSVRKWLREGKIIGVKFGSLWRVSNDNLNDFIKNAQERV